MQVTTPTTGKSGWFSNPLVQVSLPILIGVLVTGLLFYREFTPEVLSQLHFTWESGLCLLLAVLFIIGRDFGLTWRFRVLCGFKSLSWWQAFRTNMLCEFTSAVTPSAVGGSSLIVLFLKAEGIPAGKGTAIMISTLFLDELFFVVAYPLFFLLFSADELFGPSSIVITSLRTLFFIVYILITAWTAILFMALFSHPEKTRAILIRIFGFRWLKRWQKPAEKLADNLLTSSKEMSSQPLSFWIKAFGITALSWSSRFLVACALFLPFVPLGVQPLVFARQLILWIVMMISPTPGGSGFSEYMFSTYYSDILTTGGIMLIIICCWRIITYYVYLFTGICLLPGWVKNQKFFPPKEDKK